MKPLLVLLILLCGPIWIFHLPEVDARKKFPLSPAPVPSLEAPPSFPVLSSMAAFSPGSPAGEHNKMDTNKILIIVVIAASIVVGAITFSVLYFWIWHRKTSPKSHQKEDFTSVGNYNYKKMSFKKGGACLMDYKLLETATKNFQESNILGQGGFGCIYKARLDDNFHVAVKRVSDGSQDAITEFETEVDLLSQMQHPNIISLLGYSIHGETRLLVYELMDNGSLETQLYGPSRGSALNWHRRMKIALDMARGLEYLHEHCNPLVIHRDLKSSNILLDSNFNAKLSDFGLAITDGSQNKKNIKLSGTLGYVAPEYLLDGKLTDKSDVYAFGVVLLELILGRKPVEKVSEAQCQSIVTWAMPKLTDRTKLPKIVDPAIRNTMELKHLCQVAAVAVLCVQPEPSYRPFITDVLHSLIPLVPIELGGTLRSALQTPTETPSRHR
ncbi:probable receptor-like protein kinase At1g80640 isoform X1 [Rhododendron vialii]|uniref:probable receptor-like protein kinase At1g80640 isoform X1 n=1 Tax=Rhododendron vialii TaxID=182163 RepID=UPI00265E80FD|nr:probable receptor-like protein kinase At1g80640 isoform X1 [Rhododendron vialii]